MSITIELPFPPTANRYWQLARGRIIKTKQARQYEKDVLATVLTTLSKRGLGPLHSSKETLALSIAVHYPTKKRGPNMDLDNVEKVLIDSLQGYFFHNDRQLRHIQISKEKSKDKFGSVRVTVKLCPDELEVHDGTFTVKGIHGGGVI